MLIDKNEHIKNLQSVVNLENDRLSVKLSFVNISGKTITALKLNAVGYNTFGDVIKVNNKDEFTLVVQDIVVKNLEMVKDLIVYLPISDIRTLKLSENQICYVDGSVSTYLGEDMIDCDIYKLDDSVKRIVHLLFDTRMEYKPYYINSYEWICGCGKYNNSSKCSCCGIEKKCIFDNLSDNGIENLIKKNEKQEKLRQKKYNKLIVEGTIGFIFILLIASFIYKPIHHKIVLQKRTLFSSDKDMKDAIQGEYAYVSPKTGNRIMEMQIDGEHITLMFKDNSLKDEEFDISKYEPSEGEFYAGDDTFIVTKEGDILHNDDLYEKGDFMEANSNTSSESYESVYNAINISETYIYKDSSYVHCSGTITNNGKEKYKYVKVKGAFKDSDGNVIDTDWTYAIDSTELSPGESKKFDLSVKYDSKIEKCTVSIISD